MKLWAVLPQYAQLKHPQALPRCESVRGKYARSTRAVGSRTASTHCLMGEGEKGEYCVSKLDCRTRLHYFEDNGMLDEVLSIIEQLRGGAKSRLHYAQIREIMSAWAKDGVYQTYSIPAELSVHRARRLENKKWFEFVDDLGPPPPEKTITYGRCHQPQHPLCYCSLYEDAALAEVNAELGEHYVISTFTMPKDIRLIPVGELDYFRRTGRTYIGHETPQSAKPYEEALRENDWHVTALIDAFLADEFIKPAITQMDYKITSALSDVLLNGDLNPRTPIDAIVYPSVVFREGINFAILPEPYKSKMKLVEADTKIMKISDVLGYGIFKVRLLASLKSVSSDGRLKWEA